MSFKKLAALESAIALFAGFAHAQTTGEIYGKATDKSGAVVPGVTVTLTSGAYSFPRIASAPTRSSLNWPDSPPSFVMA